MKMIDPAWPEDEALDPDTKGFVRNLFRDCKAASKMLGCDEARYLVDMYYAVQHFRIQSAAQIRSMVGEPRSSLEAVAELMRIGEAGIKSNLGSFAATFAVGQWLQAIVGIGPVISAGLLAHFDVRKARTCGHFWRFAGLDPTLRWNKGEKRPWNASLKTLCVFKAGESFVKFQNHKQDVYGTIFKNRKLQELERNESGAFSDQAGQILATKKIGKSTEAYKHLVIGRLPPAHIHARARRYTVKLFVSHLHHIMHLDYFGSDPPIPFAFTSGCDGDHRHFIEPPMLLAWKAGVFGGAPLKELVDRKSVKPRSAIETEPVSAARAKD